jgi:hypothetical protein
MTGALKRIRVLARAAFQRGFRGVPAVVGFSQAKAYLTV